MRADDRRRRFGVGYAIIAAAPNAISDGLSIFLFFLGVNAMVWNDTALDGVTMKKIVEFPGVDAELPSYQQLGLMGTAIVFSFFSGYIIEGLGLQVRHAPLPPSLPDSLPS